MRGVWRLGVNDFSPRNFRTSSIVNRASQHPCDDLGTCDHAGTVDDGCSNHRCSNDDCFASR
jgi:hypothetical protein